MAKKNKNAARTNTPLVFGREIKDLFVKQGKSMGLTLLRHVPNPGAGQTLYFFDPMGRTQHKLRIESDGRLIEKENDRHPPLIRDLHAAVAEDLPFNQGVETTANTPRARAGKPGGRHARNG